MKREQALQQKVSFFYGWVIAGVSLVTVTLTAPMRSSFSVFYVAILKDFRWSRAESAGVMSIALVTTALGGLLAGWLVDKIGPRRFIPLGALVLSLGLVASSQIQSLWQYYVSFGLLTAGGVASLWFVPQGVLISKWFVSRRAAALGIALSGISIGNLLVVPFAQGLIETIGWRNAYLVLAAIVAGVLIPLNAALLRSSPQEMGLQPDGEGQEKPGKKGKPRSRTRMVVRNEQWAATEWSVPLAIRTYRFWILALINMCAGFRTSLLDAHQVISLVDKGFAPMLAATFFGLTYLWGIIGSVLWGAVSDRYGREVAQSAIALFMIAGLVALNAIRSTDDWGLLTFYALAYGVGYGGNTPVGTSIHADLFQGKNFGTILGTVNIGFGVGGALGAWFGGHVYDATASYDLAFKAVIALCFAAAVLIWVLAPRKIRAPVRERGIVSVGGQPL